MNGIICSRCKKNRAVIFITRVENGETKNEGFCLKCAKELGLKPVEDVLNGLGIDDADLDTICDQANEFMTGELQNVDENENNIGETGTGSFLRNFFGNLGAAFSGNPEPGRRPGPQQGKHAPAGGEIKQEPKFLSSFCVNISEKARTGRLDVLIGRQNEIAHAVQILNRRLKNNPCLIGEPGVGKTAIVEGIASAIAAGKAPEKLLDKEIWQLDMTALVAGTQYRGQMEGRMKGLIDEIKSLGNVILFIDEVHSIVGAGDAEGGMNAANILKPALSRGDIQVIGATTFTEYRKHIEKDSALERRFQPVKVEEPSLKEAVEIVKGVSRYYESYHNVTVPPETAEKAVQLAERYITDRFLPDKAIDLIDEACSAVNLKNPVCYKAGELGRKISALQESARVLLQGDVSPQKEKELAQLQKESGQLEKQRDALLKNGLPVLTEENLAAVVELWTGIPAGKINESEQGRLLKLEPELKKRIIGQDSAVESLCRAIKRRRAGLGSVKKPVSFLFAGPTGVGKTEVVKQLAARLFDGPDALIRLDMSEYMEKHAVSRIIGSPPGYVGYEEAGQLTETVRRRPYSVILLDEIEKAHPDIMNILLQILDEGRITDAHGRQVDFSHTVIVLTTNAGSESHGAAVAGFTAESGGRGKEAAMRALKEFLRPEFLNRLDDIIYFNHLDRDAIARIAGIFLKEMAQNMALRGIRLHYTDSVCAFIASESYSEAYGARSTRRYIEENVEDRIAEAVLSSEAPVTDVRLQMRTNGKLAVVIQ